MSGTPLIEKRRGVRSGWQGNNRLGGGEKREGGREVGKGQVTVAIRKGQEV